MNWKYWNRVVLYNSLFSNNIKEKYFKIIDIKTYFKRHFIIIKCLYICTYYKGGEQNNGKKTNITKKL